MRETVEEAPPRLRSDENTAESPVPAAQSSATSCSAETAIWASGAAPEQRARLFERVLSCLGRLNAGRHRREQSIKTLIPAQS